MTQTLSCDEIALRFADICAEAAAPVMQVYRSDFESFQKSDRSPVTEADQLAEALILDRLRAFMPDTPVIAEEQFEAGVRPNAGTSFILVDPVDGTKEFIRRNGEFTINIGLIRDGAPVAGAVCAPAMDEVYFGGSTAQRAPITPGQPIERDAIRPIACRTVDPGRICAVMSRSHGDERTRRFIAEEGVSETVSAGSSLKFCLLAAGQADVYPRFAPTMEWDTAAGHAVLLAAGGCVIGEDGEALRYGKEESGFRNGPFIARTHSIASV
ncbi:MAG: 3'(2'),5'-bisphosphate nucleotidase CysQ [Pseudomonadota bacterium]